jgi:hypothetical protein
MDDSDADRVVAGLEAALGLKRPNA